MEDDETILDKLFEIRHEEMRMTFAEEHRKQLEENETNVRKEELKQTIQKLFDLDKDKMFKVIVAIEEYEGTFVDELDFWCKKYYKLGIADAKKVKKECDEIGEKDGKVI